uniref:Transposase Helix-turn-helix domain-containing protein n=1 Tax=Graphocephala atropunctata TaxID=36148 RepID=A0A1B6KX11_9HEMI
MSRRRDLLLAAAITVILGSQRRKRRFWVRPSLASRNKYSATDLLRDLNDDDHADDPSLKREIRCDGSFKNFLRMTSEDFEYIIGMIGHKIERKNTTFRDAIPVREKLAVTLRFLASGDSYQSLSYLFKISKSAISLFIPLVCEALIDLLQDYIKVSPIFRKRMDGSG